MKIVVLDGYTMNPGDLSWEKLRNLGELKVYDRTTDKMILDRIGDAGAVFVNKTPLSAETITRLLKVKFIGVLATGYNVVDINMAGKMGIVVSNVPGYSTHAVAQMVMALLLELCHRTGAHSDAVRNGEWSRSADFTFRNFPLVELYGKTMGIIGLGKIGMSVAELARAFGMNVIAYSRTRKNNDVSYVGLNELLVSSDVISLNAPLTNETKGMINCDAIKKMKNTAMLINTSRGQLIVEQDLADALNSGKLAGAAMDVLSEEPPCENNPLLSAKNCIVTPHIAWATREARQRLMDISVMNLKAFLDGKPSNSVTG